MKISKVVLTAALAFSAWGAQAAYGPNLVQNGSFEENAQAGGTWNIYASLNDWTALSGGIELRNNVSGTAQDGSNFVELDTTKNSAMGQVVHITGPGAYELSFWYNARTDNGGLPSNTDKLGWSLAGFGFGVAGGTVLPNWTTDNTSTWTQFTRVFDFNHAGDVLLGFAALGKSDSYGGSIDNVSLRAVTAVPEPETFAMLLAGLGLMGTIARRRRNKQA